MDIYKIKLAPYGCMTSFPDSQTIFGSICWSIRELYGEKDLEQLLENFINDEHRFVVSSSYIDGIFKAPMMIWATLEEIIRKSGKTGIDGNRLSTLSKHFKNIRYFSEKILRDYLEGEIRKEEVVEDIILEKGKYELQNGLLSYASENKKDIFSEYSKVNGRRNFINRLSGTTEEGQLFYYQRRFLMPHDELYFLMKTTNIDYFLPLFRYISDGAIGGDKSIGANNFTVMVEEKFEYKKLIDENILLSKFIPNYDEVDWCKSNFDISTGHCKVESRHEFLGKDITKDQITCLIEGSKIVFKQRKEIYGKLPIVKELMGKKIRHNGLGFFL